MNRRQQFYEGMVRVAVSALREKATSAFIEVYVLERILPMLKNTRGNLQLLMVCMGVR